MTIAFNVYKMPFRRLRNLKPLLITRFVKLLTCIDHTTVEKPFFCLGGFGQTFLSKRTFIYLFLYICTIHSNMYTVLRWIYLFLVILWQFFILKAFLWACTISEYLSVTLKCVHTLLCYSNRSCMLWPNVLQFDQRFTDHIKRLVTPGLIHKRETSPSM